jgi:putative tryptophan/tyrosine transport system substrate-binding protein
MQFDQLRRREFITLLGGAAATWPLRAQAQQPSMPVIGYLSTRSLGDSAHIVAAFRKGLHEVGYTEGRNVAIEFRFAEGHHDRLQALTADLVRRQVNVFVATGGTASAVAAKPIVPATIPMVFAMGGDPVKLGIVDGLARPGGNVTGISFLVSEMAAKHVQLLNELAPKTAVIGFLANPSNPNLASAATEAQKAADMLSLKLVVVNASAERDFDPAFTTLVQQRVDSLFVEVDPFFTDQRARIAALAARHALPSIYALREFVDAGGLMSYGTSITDANRQLGIYTGRVLKGTKPAELPVMQSTIFELVINLKAAKALGLEVPTSILLRANELIE